MPVPQTGGAEGAAHALVSGAVKSLALPLPQRIGDADGGAGVRMRGRSFSEDVMASTRSALILALLERYTLREGRAFADVPSFLSTCDEGGGDGAGGEAEEGGPAVGDGDVEGAAVAITTLANRLQLESGARLGP